MKKQKLENFVNCCSCTAMYILMGVCNWRLQQLWSWLCFIFFSFNNASFMYLNVLQSSSSSSHDQSIEYAWPWRFLFVFLNLTDNLLQQTEIYYFFLNFICHSQTAAPCLIFWIPAQYDGFLAWYFGFDLDLVWLLQTGGTIEV